MIAVNFPEKDEEKIYCYLVRPPVRPGCLIFYKTDTLLFLFTFKEREGLQKDTDMERDRKEKKCHI